MARTGSSVVGATIRLSSPFSSSKGLDEGSDPVQLILHGGNMHHKEDNVFTRGPARHAQICSQLQEFVGPEVQALRWWKRDNFKYLAVGLTCTCLVGWRWWVSVGRGT